MPHEIGVAQAFLRENMFMSPETGDELDMVRLEYFGAGMETEVVRGLLEANGIPTTLVGATIFTAINSRPGAC